MMAEYEAGRAQRHKFGATYRCKECNLMLPAEAYDVNRHDISELHNMCIGLGSLRLCTVCAQVPASTSTARCARCTQQRPLGYFSSDSDVCQPCLQLERYQFKACSMCRKAFQLGQLRQTAEGRRLCHECAPEAWPYRCTACTEYKPASAFNHSRKELETAFHTRCKTCETCTACKRHFSDHRSMAPDRRICTTCAALSNRRE